MLDRGCWMSDLDVLRLPSALQRSTIHQPRSSWSAPDSPPVRPDTCTLAAFAPRCSIGCLPGSTAASSFCGSTTPISSGTSKRRCSRSSTACTGWASIGTRGRKWAGRSHPITSRSGWIAIRTPSKSCWPAAMPTTITPRPAELQAEREAAEREKRPFRYSRRFMAETPADRAAFESQGRQAVVRLKMPTEGTLVLDDLVRGRVEFEWASEQDHVVQRTDGTCLYHLANVVDDHDFQITHVIRAEEHLSNTPRQVFILEALGYPRPAYAHLPFVAEPGSRNKLSKRKLDKYLKNRDFAELVEHGRKIAAAIGHAGRGRRLQSGDRRFLQDRRLPARGDHQLPGAVGLVAGRQDGAFFAAGVDREVFAGAGQQGPGQFRSEEAHGLRGLAFPAAFARSRRSRWPCRFWKRPDLSTRRPTAEQRETIEKVVAAAGDRIKVAGDILHVRLFLPSDDQLEYDEQAVEKHLAEAGAARVAAKVPRPTGDRRAVRCGKPRIADAAISWPPKAIKIGQIIHAVRVAVTGKSIGLGLFDTLAISAESGVLRRIERALARI